MMAATLEVVVKVTRQTVIHSLQEECEKKLANCRVQLGQSARDLSETDREARTQEIIEEDKYDKIYRSQQWNLELLKSWLEALVKPEAANVSGSILRLRGSGREEEIWLICEAEEHGSAPIDHTAIAQALNVDTFMMLSSKCPLYARGIAGKTIRAGTEISLETTGNKGIRWEVLEIL